MSPSRIHRLVLSTIIATMGCVVGCCESGAVEGSSGAGGGAGGSGYWPTCLWGGSGGGLTFPVCPAPQTNEFIGTIDGKPYDNKDSGHITGMQAPTHPPYYLSLNLGGVGSLDMTWGNPFVRGQWMHINGGGTLVLPQDGMFRAVFADSQVLVSCDDYSFLYILHVTGGDLTGCSR